MALSKKLSELVDTICGYRQSLLDSISGLSRAQRDYKPEGDGWSIGDIVHHLALTDEANAKLVSKMLKQARALGLPPDPEPDRSMLDCLSDYADKIKNTRSEERRVGKECRSRWSPY